MPNYTKRWKSGRFDQLSNGLGEVPGLIHEMRRQQKNDAAPLRRGEWNVVQSLATADTACPRDAKPGRGTIGDKCRARCRLQYHQRIYLDVP